MRRTTRRVRQRVTRALFGILLLLTLFPAASSAYPRPGVNERVSLASDGAEGNNVSSREISISADGRYVAFSSDASNLAPGDTNGSSDVFVRDRVRGILERISVAADGMGANSFSDGASISADGRFVAFRSDASNLVADDSNGFSDTFVRDRATGITERVSVSSSGGQGNHHSWPGTISADGGHIAFLSCASNLVLADTNGDCDIFVYERATARTERVSVGTDEAQANLGSASVVAISADGRYVSFSSEASNLVPGDTNGNLGDEFGQANDVFVRDRLKGVTERVSVATDGAEANMGSGGSAISSDGRYVAFLSPASNLVPGDTNLDRDIFVRDRAKGTTERVSVASDGGQSDPGFLGTSSPVISADGRYVAFGSYASNLVPADTNADRDVFVHDRATGTTDRVSVADDGTEGNSESAFEDISADGRYVAFGSHASNLVPGDTNGYYDAFVRDRIGSLDIGGRLSLVRGSGGVEVSGRATFSGATLISATDEPDDGARLGPLAAADLGAELTGVELIYRPEQEDLLVRLRLSSLPYIGMNYPAGFSGGESVGAGLPGVLYGLRLESAESTFEVRAVRGGDNSIRASAPRVALYRCESTCTELSSLTGSFGSTGDEVLVSIPLAAVGATAGSEIAPLRAFTAAGESVSGALQSVDEVPLPATLIPTPRVELGLAPAAVPEDRVDFNVGGSLDRGRFSGTISAPGDSPGSHRVWARACLGESCGSAVFGRLDL